MSKRNSTGSLKNGTARKPSNGRAYKYIFFDLDHTLWDYETNSDATLQELYVSYDLKGFGIHECKSFCDQFRKVNTVLWDSFDRGLITSDVIRKQRFKQILEHFSAYHEDLSERLSLDYLNNCPRKENLIPYAIEVLQYLKENYSLTIVTNGFDEIQSLKLNAGNLRSFFSHIVTSQKAGHRKPAREIFEYAMSINKTTCEEVIMIGDNLITDIGGARNACIDTVFFNPDGINHNTEVTHEIKTLAELKNFL